MVGQTPFDIDGDDLVAGSVSTAARRAEEQFVDYLREEAGHDIDLRDVSPRDAIGSILHQFRESGFDIDPRDGSIKASVFVDAEFYGNLGGELDDMVRVGVSGETPPEIRVNAAEVRADSILDAGELLAVHHDAIVPSPVATDWRQYLVRAPKGVAVAEVSADE